MFVGNPERLSLDSIKYILLTYLLTYSMTYDLENLSSNACSQKKYL